MGNWRITIEGHGAHHNGRQDDADTMAATFVGELRAANHQVDAASMVLTNDPATVRAQTTDLLPLVPEIDSEAWRVRGQDEHGNRLLVGEGPGKRPVRSTYTPAAEVPAGLMGEGVAEGGTVQRYGSAPGGRPGIGDVVDFVRENVSHRGTVAGFSGGEFGLPRTASVFVLGTPTPYIVEPGVLAVVRAFDPGHFRD
jgi:hypothetical protein